MAERLVSVRGILRELLLAGGLLAGMGPSSWAVGEADAPAARMLFYQAVDHADSLDAAVAAFRLLRSTRRMAPGLAEVYLGALIALEGKHAWLPITKYRRTLAGLEAMDRGIALAPDNIEARFIRGMTCYHLPFFFRRNHTFREDFRATVGLLESGFRDYDPATIWNVVSFLEASGELTEAQAEIIERVRRRLE